MLPIITLIFVIAFSMLISKIATIALIHTGMTRERARFQARSAFTGAGFTTSESEVVVKHPVRRQIIMALILLGNAGIVTAISSLILGFVGKENSFSHMWNIYLLFIGISLLYLSTRSKRLDRFLERIINRSLEKFTSLRPRNFETMISVMEDYEVTEISVEKNQWLKEKKLADLNLPDEGILVLGIIREDIYIGVPRGRYEIEGNDRLVVYGRAGQIQKLCQRYDELAAKQKHKESVEEHREEMKEQDEKVESKKEEGPSDS